MSSVSSFLRISLLSAGLVRAGEFRVCADPDNLPFSNVQEEGFESRLARMVAGDLGRALRYTWSPQRARFLRAVREGRCDVVMGVPVQLERLVTTQPYYRSSYVFVTRAGSAAGSFD